MPSAYQLQRTLDTTDEDYTVGLCTGSTLDATTGAMAPVGEPTDGGYAPVLVPATDTTAGTYEADAWSAESHNTSEYTWPECVGGTYAAMFSHAVIRSAATGDVVDVVPLSQGVTVRVGDVPRLRAGMFIRRASSS